MNRTVELVNEWAAFETNHPSGNIEEFCRHYLAKNKKQEQTGQLVGGVVPPSVDGLLLKIIGRISKLNMSYANLALKETGLNQIEEFGMLMTIKIEKNPRKTDVIYANLFELSSGTDMLNRMKSRGLIMEYDDQDDKRAKRIELTAEGTKVVEQCYQRIMMNAQMLTSDLTSDDKELCIQLLKGIEMKFSALWPQHKGKPFSTVYESVMKSGSNDSLPLEN
ncbi:MarR family winged helix-turn-helix transcriptional regulator [Dyadobacter sp. MSC1_007]|jgi:DNA-binding MarR family transcriptional regulator|uniref:MarR family winged helix-turn-helix transcriptional regulator n=1 Tax=Dyadobacter sp. MSC1_007 TaxID=2909264 RepID=UPI00202F2B1A|nr:hypothetical protein [Dyadobacter sp. MSC1_007]